MSNFVKIADRTPIELIGIDTCATLSGEYFNKREVFIFRVNGFYMTLSLAYFFRERTYLPERGLAALLYRVDSRENISDIVERFFSRERFICYDEEDGDKHFNII